MEINLQFGESAQRGPEACNADCMAHDTMASFTVSLQAGTAAAGSSGSLSKAEVTERIMLAQLQSAVYEYIAASAASEARSVFGMRLPGLGQAAPAELSPEQFCLYEDVLGSGLPTAQERR